MADEGNELRIRWMDLNLYLGLPRSPRRRVLGDLGSDLALGSAAPADMSVVAESSDPGDAPYSPTLPSYNHEERTYSPTNPAYHPGDQIPAGEPVPAEDNSHPPSIIYEPVVLQFEEPGGLYSPTNALPTVEENDELDLSPPYAPISPPRGSPRASEANMPYLPSGVSFSSAQRVAEDTDFDFAQLMSREVGSSSREDLISSPELRFRRLIEVNNRLRRRHRFWMSTSGDEERPHVVRPPSPVVEHHVYDSSQALLFRKQESPAKHAATEVSDDDAKEKIKAAANFECNICLDMATEPVVTSCGHLFCWPCLYQWLHLHSDHKECPVCKGEVVETNVIPIYGRGSSESSDDKKLEKKEEACLEIPPRPRGSRFESFRQQFRPSSRRVGEGIANSWRRLVARRDTSLTGMYDSMYQRAPLTRTRARRIERGEVVPEAPPHARESGLPRDGSSIPPTSGSSLLFRDGDPWRAFNFHTLSNTDRLSAMAADLSGVVGRFGSNTNLFGASTSAVNLLPSEPPVARAPAPTSSAAEASASSTMAVIQGDAAPVDASAEPNSAGSSRIYRRRGRSSTSGSLDADGAALHGEAAATNATGEPSSPASSRNYRRRGRSSASGSLDVDGGALHVRKRRRMN